MSDPILTRTLSLTNPLLRGSDVARVQKLLNSKGFPCTIDGVFGPETAARCAEAKTRLRYPKPEQQPTCGPPLVAALEAHAPFKPKPLLNRRVRYVEELRSLLTESSRWRYAQIRPIPHSDRGIVTTDCSGAVTLAAELSGCPDPNGYGFNGRGWTGSIGSRCAHIPRSLLQPGDLVLFGPGYPWHHVCAVLDDVDTDPLLFSHGRQGDPRAVRLSVELASQANAGHPGVTYCSFL